MGSSASGYSLIEAQRRLVDWRLAMRLAPEWWSAVEASRLGSLTLSALPILRLLVTADAELRDQAPHSERKKRALDWVEDQLSPPPNADGSPPQPYWGALIGGREDRERRLAFYSEAKSVGMTGNDIARANYFSGDPDRQMQAEFAPLIDRFDLLQLLCGGSTRGMLKLLRGDPEVLSEWIGRAPVNCVERDVQALSTGKELRQTPLWYDDKEQLRSWAFLYQKWTERGGVWAVLAEWYQRALDGKPQNWPLLRDVALIPDEIWREGGEALDQAISLIVERHHLLELARGFKRGLDDAERGGAAIPGIGHNNPPENEERYSAQFPRRASLLDVAREIDKQFGDVVPELEKKEPSVNRLRQIGEALKAASLAVVRYIAHKADLALENAAKQLGTSGAKWAIGGSIAYIIAQNKNIAEFAEALIRFAGKQ